MNGNFSRPKRFWLENILLPAAAGNILWAFLQHTTNLHTLDGVGSIASIYVILVVMMLYLSLDWMILVTRERPDLPAKFLIFEFLHIIALALVSIAAVKADWSSALYFFSLYFAVTVSGHLMHAWELRSSTHRPHLLLYGNAIGASLIGIGWYWHPEFFVPVGYVLSLIVWMFARKETIQLILSTINQSYEKSENDDADIA